MFWRGQKECTKLCCIIPLQWPLNRIPITHPPHTSSGFLLIQFTTLQSFLHAQPHHKPLALQNVELIWSPHLITGYWGNARIQNLFKKKAADKSATCKLPLQKLQADLDDGALRRQGSPYIALSAGLMFKTINLKFPEWWCCVASATSFWECAGEILVWQSFIMMALASNGDRSWSYLDTTAHTSLYNSIASRTLTPPSLTSHQRLPTFPFSLPTS